jgi:glycosyltransferase involved in cell wall biosynthesis
MKRLLVFLILLAAGFAAGFGAARGKAVEFFAARIKASNLPYRAIEFRPTQYPLENRMFHIVIVGRNNGANLEKTLQSVFLQNYENFRILYIDDASDDGSGDLARDLIYDSPCFTKIQFHQNERPLGLLESLSKAVRGIPDEEIVAVLQGDDWLAHEWVIARLNQYYADPDLWLTYGEASDYPTYRLGNAKPLDPRKPVRSQPFSGAHLKTFYAGLFKKIGEADLQYKGEYFQGAADLAYMFPMLEMAEGHTQCLQDVLYICNRESLKTDDRELHSFCEKEIRSLPAHEPLTVGF